VGAWGSAVFMPIHPLGRYDLIYRQKLMSG